MTIDEASNDPQGLATATARAGLFQDVVLATTRVLHGTALEADDRHALEECRKLLGRVASPKVGFPVGGGQQLASTSETLAFLRAARSGGGPPDPKHFKELADAVKRSEAGDRSKEVLSAIAELREILLVVGQLDLNDSLAADDEREASPSWTPLTASLSS